MAAPRQYEMNASATVLATTTLVAPDRCSVDNERSPLQSQTLIRQRRRDRCQAAQWNSVERQFCADLSSALSPQHFVMKISNFKCFMSEDLKLEIFITKC